MKFAVINTETNKLVQPRNYYFVIKQNGELWTVNHDLSFTKADDKFKVVSELRELFDNFYKWHDSLTVAESDKHSLTSTIEEYFFKIKIMPKRKFYKS
ncbi:MAG: hypothetical protein HN704_14700 [Bacteroidetes bacterium]|jgi:hypothetical protein|nr:hypothetical protein [Bacteroidota bacterium]MBT7492847.1 hypothetical protein [Bacteroidota bacterium]